MKYIIAGDLMVDVVTVLHDAEIHYGDDNRATVELHGGGAAANVASWMGRSGLHPHFYCAIGDDIIGHALIADLKHVGVDVHATHIDGPTGAVVALVHLDGERTMFPSSEANGALPENALDGVVREGDHVHLSGYVLLRDNSRAKALHYLKVAKDAGATVSMDPASARLIEVMGAQRALEAMRGVDLLIANEAEAMMLTGARDPESAARGLADHFPTAIVKLGPDGACAWADGVLVSRPAIKSVVIDTVGAGDAFAAGAIPVWKDRAHIADVLDAGNLFGHRAVEQRGARPLP